jgi:hypothetical protein
MMIRPGVPSVGDVMQGPLHVVPSQVPARGARFGREPIPGPAMPTSLYHFTTTQAWEKIQASGGLQPRAERKGGLKGVFAFEPKTFMENWCQPTRYFGSGLQLTLFAMRQKLKASSNPEQSCVQLKIYVDPQQDTILVREQSYPFKPFLWWLKNPRQTLAPLADYLSGSQRFEMPEFIITNPVPLDRIQVERVFSPDRFPAEGELLRYRFDPDRLLNVLTNPDAPPVRVTDEKPLAFKWHVAQVLLKKLLSRTFKSDG